MPYEAPGTAMTQDLRSGPGLRYSIRESLCFETKPEPCGMVIFGASGDLCARKILPALRRLGERSLLPERFFVLGVGRSAFDPASLRKGLPQAAGADYLQGDYTSEDTYRRLKLRLQELSNRHDTRGNTVFYLALPPALFHDATHRLGEAGLLEEDWGGWARVVFEKPFGRDLASALALAVELGDHLKESQVYRIDHYLGKDTVQNVLMLRFANAIFEPIWNRDHIDHVQISALETESIGRRAGYYDSAGVLRDMFQNHMLQLLSLVAMEPPASFAPDWLRDEKVKVFRALRPWADHPPIDNAVLGQYAGYPGEPGVARDSRTPTFAAMRLFVDNWRWQGVPFYLRSGKSLRRRSAEIAVTFKPVPHSVFKPLLPAHLDANTLVFHIQPREGIALTIEAKKPGPKICMGALTMDFDYLQAFGEHPPEAYERLLLDIMLGDQTLFTRHDALEESWRFLEPLLKAELPLRSYAPGYWGPQESEALPAADNRAWRQPDER
ncbi:MAG: glucose-6-phosphate dehydrogenase [Elusimicrobia bacterium]|nr:glucose-6-phosphate dehydrogenase [Elusimicrobiota bacterium]